MKKSSLSPSELTAITFDNEYRLIKWGLVAMLITIAYHLPYRFNSDWGFLIGLVIGVLALIAGHYLALNYAERLNKLIVKHLTNPRV